MMEVMHAGGARQGLVGVFVTLWGGLELFCDQKADNLTHCNKPTPDSLLCSYAIKHCTYIDRVPYFYQELKAYFSYLYGNIDTLHHS